RLLPAHRQAAPVTQAAIAADLLQSLDVLRLLAPQISLDRERLVDRVAQLGNLVLGQVAHVGVGADSRLRQQLVRLRPADPENIGQTDLRALDRKSTRLN